jgi:hypothetical protein
MRDAGPTAPRQAGQLRGRVDPTRRAAYHRVFSAFLDHLSYNERSDQENAREARGLAIIACRAYEEAPIGPDERIF